MPGLFNQTSVVDGWNAEGAKAGILLLYQTELKNAS
jgi:hypothetical protein